MAQETYKKEGVKVIRLLKNHGKGFAVKVGMLSAGGRRRLMVDADGATQFDELRRLESALRGAYASSSSTDNFQTDSVKYDIAFGSR